MSFESPLVNVSLSHLMSAVTPPPPRATQCVGPSWDSCGWNKPFDLQFEHASMGNFCSLGVLGLLQGGDQKSVVQKLDERYKLTRQVREVKGMMVTNAVGFERCVALYYRGYKGIGCVSCCNVLQTKNEQLLVVWEQS